MVLSKYLKGSYNGRNIKCKVYRVDRVKLGGAMKKTWVPQICESESLE